MSTKVYSREQIANFIHNASEMEKRIHILNETKNSCTQSSNKILTDVKKKIQNIENEKLKKENLFNREIGAIKNYEKKKTFSLTAFIQKIEESFKDIIRFARFLLTKGVNFSEHLFSRKNNATTFLGSCLSFFVYGYLGIFALLLPPATLTFTFLATPFFLIGNFSTTPGFFIIICFLCPWIIAAAIAFIRRTILESKSCKRSIETYTALNKHTKEELENTTTALALAKQEYNLAKEKSSFLLQQAKICENASKEINTLLQNYYKETDIVKQDFRRADCVIILDFAFRNDLVDTVREGINYYETKVFRYEIIKGIKNICSRLDELTTIVSALGADLECINENIDRLNANSEEIISQFSVSIGLQKDMLATQKLALERSKATQYAIDSLRDSYVRYNTGWY